MAVSVLWAVSDGGGEEEGENQHYQLSQWSSAKADSETRVRVDYLGESLQCQLAVDRFFSPMAPAEEVYSSLEPHLLGVLHGQPATCFVRMGPRPEHLPLGVLLGDMSDVLAGRWQSDSALRPEDGIAVRVVKRLFDEMQHAVRGGEDAYSVKMGFSCFMNSPTKPTDLLKNVRQHVPTELEWGAVEGVLHAHDAPGKYIYATSASDVLRTLAKLVSSESFLPVAHRLSYALHFIVLRTSAHAPPSTATDSQVAHLCFMDVHPEHTLAAHRALAPVLQQMIRRKESRGGVEQPHPAATHTPSSGRRSDAVFDGRFVGSPLSPGTTLMSPGRASDGVFSRCLGLLTGCGSGGRLVVLAASRGGIQTSSQSVQSDAVASVLQLVQKSGPVLPVAAAAAKIPALTPPSAPYVVRPSPSPHRHGSRPGTLQSRCKSPTRPSQQQQLRPFPLSISTPRATRSMSPPHPLATLAPTSPAESPRRAPSADALEEAAPRVKTARRDSGTPELARRCDALRAEGVAKDCKISQLEAQLEVALSRADTLSDEESARAAAASFRAEAARSEAAAARRELDVERERRAEDSAAWREFINSLERTWAERLAAVESAPQPGQNEGHLRVRVMAAETAADKAERSRAEADADVRGALSELKQQSARSEAMAARIQDLEGRLLSEAVAREASDREAARARKAHQTVSAQLEQSRRLQGVDADARRARDESAVLRRELSSLAEELETVRGALRHAQLRSGAAAIAERERHHERERADRARICADYTEQLLWISQTCFRLRSVYMPSGATPRRSPGRHFPLHGSPLQEVPDRETHLARAVAELRCELDDARSSAQREQAAAGQQLGRLEEQINIANRDRARQAEACRVLEEHTAALRAELEAVREKLAAAQAAASGAEQERVLVADEAEAGRRRERDLIAEASKRERDLSRLGSELSAKDEQITHLREQLSRAQRSVDSNRAADMERARLEKRMIALEAEKLRLQQQLDAKVERGIAGSAERLSTQAKIEELSVQSHLLAAENQAKDRDLAALRAERDGLVEERRQRKSWEHSVQKEIKEKTQTLDSIERLLEDEQLREEKQEQELARLRAELRQSQAEVAALRSRPDDAARVALHLPMQRDARNISPPLQRRNLSPPLDRPDTSPKPPRGLALQADHHRASPQPPSISLSPIRRHTLAVSPPLSSPGGSSPPRRSILITEARHLTGRDFDLDDVRVRPQAGVDIPLPPPPQPIHSTTAHAVHRAEKQLAKLRSDLAAMPPIPQLPNTASAPAPPPGGWW
eukprot:TRINITY_DN12926_c0_g1_i1.p1 TRINITY_DN12926_c0_g1~~TRINITY_DN12926_c0_g1_i1.p1  ORF type:complete len:1299 (+),score=316.19 TRINITY_DN12926_c0_g1_i1:53-3898(+)